MADDDLMWTMAASGAALGAATLARKVVTKGWESRRGAVPAAKGPGDTTWKEAVAWAVVSGVVVSLARYAAQSGVTRLKLTRDAKKGLKLS